MQVRQDLSSSNSSRTMPRWEISMQASVRVNSLYLILISLWFRRTSFKISNLYPPEQALRKYLTTKWKIPAPEQISNRHILLVWALQLELPNKLLMSLILLVKKTWAVILRKLWCMINKWAPTLWIWWTAALKLVWRSKTLHVEIESRPLIKAAKCKYRTVTRKLAAQLLCLLMMMLRWMMQPLNRFHALSAKELKLTKKDFLAESVMELELLAVICMEMYSKLSVIKSEKCVLTHSESKLRFTWLKSNWNNLRFFMRNSFAMAVMQIQLRVLDTCVQFATIMIFVKSVKPQRSIHILCWRFVSLSKLLLS